MIRRLYQRLLQREVISHPSPDCVAMVLCNGDLEGGGQKKVHDLATWCREIGVMNLVLHMNQHSLHIANLLEDLFFDFPGKVTIFTPQGKRLLGRGREDDPNITISMGYGGKKEVTEAIRALLIEVENARLIPEEINEQAIERELRFSQKPDLVIRSGGKQLSDFMIWQAAYSELHFTEVNWSSFRKIDFLRAIRDYQRRERRFGR